MILPNKHLKFSESLFGLGGFILTLLSRPTFVENLWEKFEKINNTEKFPAYRSFDHFLLSLDYLFAIGAIDLDQEGKIYNINRHETT